MGLYKEQAAVFEKVERLQRQVWPDAADVGIVVSVKSDPAVKAVKTAIFEIKDLVQKRETWGDNVFGGVTVDIFIPWEEDDGCFIGTKYHITYNFDSRAPRNKRAKNFITVWSESASQRKSPWDTAVKVYNV